MIILISVLALLVVLGGMGLIANAFSNRSAQSSANATATANANTNATATANANATATVAPAAQLSGNWANVDSKTLGITKMTITNKGTNITVHPYSKCSQTDCDWGTQSSQYTGSPFKITFVVNGRSHNLAISTQGTQLKVVEGIRTYLFNKG